MMVVLVIIFIITAIAMPNFWGGYKSKEAKGAAREIASILKAAKSYAQTQNTKYDVMYWYANDDATNGETWITIDIYNDFDTNGSGRKVGKSTKLHLNPQYTIDETFDGIVDDNRITFYPDGHADDADGDPLGDETISLTLPDGKSITITINENTGSVMGGDLEL